MPKSIEELKKPLDLTATKLRAFWLDLDPDHIFGKGGVRNVCRCKDVTNFEKGTYTTAGVDSVSKLTAPSDSARNYLLKVIERAAI